MPDTAQGTRIQYGDGGSPEAYADFGTVTSVSGPAISNTVIDVTSLIDTAREKVSAGVADGGEVTVGLWFNALATSAHDTLVDRALAGTGGNYAIVWSNITANTVTFTANVNDTLTSGAAHGVHTGEPVRVVTDDTLPSPLVADTTYFAINLTATTFKLATTNANAVAGTQIDITNVGAGTHTLKSPSKILYAAEITGATPSGDLDGAVTGEMTFMVDGALTITD